MLVQVWNGQIATEIKHPQTGKSIYLMLHRCSYLPLYLNTIRKLLFDMFAIPLGSQVWFSYNPVPSSSGRDQDQLLRWHLPIGLLFDLCKYHDVRVKQMRLPWLLTVHSILDGEKFPHDVILEDPSADNMQLMFMHSLKQADYLIHGESNALLALTRAEQVSLWNGLLSLPSDPSGSYEKFMSVVVQKLRVPVKQVKQVPIRFHVIKSDFFPAVLQGPCSVFDSDSEIIMTLQQTFDSLIKQRTDSGSVAFVHSSVMLISHGIELPGDTPISWLLENMNYADLFIHIIAKLNNH